MRILVARRRMLAMTAGAFPSLDTAVNVAFPAIDEHFSLSVADLQWIVITYLLTYGSLLVVAGRIGDSIGHRRLVWWGSAISVIALAGCAAAPSFLLFLAARVAQGLGAALVLAGAPALLTTSSDEGLGRGRAAGLFQTATMIGLTVGPVVGGPLVELAGWRAVYWFRLPIAVGLWVLASGFDDQEAPDAGSDVDGVDSTEMALGVGAIAGLVGVMSLGRTWGWLDIRLAAAAVLALVLAIGFVHRNLATSRPMIDPRLWRRPGFTTANIVNAVANGAMFPTWLLVPTLLVDEMSVSVIAAGFVLAASPAVSSVGSLWVSRLVDSTDPVRLVALGLATQALGMVILGMVGPDGSVAAIIAGMGIIGAGLGIFLAPNMHEVMTSLPMDRQGVAGGLSLMMRTLGIVIAVAIASAIFDPIERDHGFGPAFRIVFLAFAGALALAAAASLRPRRQDRRNRMRINPS